MNLSNPEVAECFVCEQLGEQPRRLAHVLRVTEKVRESAKVIEENHPELPFKADLAICAALLHDIGYAKSLAVTGFHPIDGFNFLKQQGFDELARLIVGHSCSPEEAELNGLDEIISSDSLEAKLVTYWDMRVKQGGRLVSYEERLNDIITRYGEHSIVSQANLKAQGRLTEEFVEVEKLLKYDK